MKQVLKIIKLITLLIILLNTKFANGQTATKIAIDSNSQNRKNSFDLEFGILATKNIEFRGYQQLNATKNWKSTTPAIRFEYWNKSVKKWNFGVAVQPIYFSYQDTIKNDLNYKGKIYSKGEQTNLIYQFHNLTLSSNYPIFYRNKNTYFRAGGTLIYRYADISFKTNVNSFRDKNFIIFPLLHYDLGVKLSNKMSFVSRADFLPSLTQNVFLDGLFNVYLGFQKHLDIEKAINIGSRLFFGGFDENKPDDYANRTFFWGIVGKYTF